VARYNQGWIVDKVMQHVPKLEPFAAGATLEDALISAVVPRVLYSDKAIAGGRSNMKKYAGLVLGEGTSMNLGYAGEMYANFGYWGGIIGCGCYCLALALLFRAVCVRAFVSPLWWAIVPYVFVEALKAEDDIMDVVNWIAKASLVLVGVCVLFPSFQRALFPERKRGERCQVRGER
jgi:hypothetical protein